MSSKSRSSSPVRLPPGRCQALDKTLFDQIIRHADRQWEWCVVACLAASAAGFECVQRTSGGSRTNSAARAGSRSAAPQHNGIRGDVVPLHIAEVAQPLLKGNETGRREAAWEPGSSTPTWGFSPAAAPVAASGAASRLRVSVTMHPTALYHMVISLRRSYADRLLSMEAERWRSAAAGSGSEGRADAVGSQVQCLVRHGRA